MISIVTNDTSKSVIDDSSVMLQIVASITIIIYDHNVLIVQATSCSGAAKGLFTCESDFALG